jgi:hypothetical protein
MSDNNDYKTYHKVALVMLKENQTYNRFHKLTVYMFVTISIIAAVDYLCINLGQDINYDLFNYHYVNGYLFINGLLINDSIGIIQSYLDPLLNSLYYILISSLPPILSNIAIATVQSVAIIGVFFVSSYITNKLPLYASSTISVMLCICAIIGPTFYSEIGTVMSDTLLSALVIFSIYSLIRTFDHDSFNIP